MIVYRIEKKKYRNTLTGFGGTLAPGRWNHARYPIIYTSMNPSTARLETLLNWSSSLVPKNRFRLKIHIPDSIAPKQIEKSELPDDWRDYPHSLSTREIGNTWLESINSVTLMVPCAEEPDEWNVLINPLHPDFRDITIEEVIPIVFNERLRP